MPHSVEIGKMRLGDGNFFLIAGPCVIENEDLVLKTAEIIARIAAAHKVPLIFKSSYDKANRTAVSSFRGMGMEEGLKILQKVKETVGVPVLSDVHGPEEATAAAKAVDVLQIPAFLCRQTDLLIAAAETGKVVNVKKGQFLAPWDMKNVVEKLESTGNRKIFLTERGASFGYNNLVSDMRSLVIMRRTGYPVVFDGTHSVQLPGGGGKVSSGQREFVLPLTRAAVAAGCDGLFLEVHPSPDQAPSDGPNMIDPAQLDQLLGQVGRILEALGERKAP
ncbi:MAG: 3-deoxy-8-phosphooctulonate synthase [Candidatus Manganitrophus sp.]|nr:MAG: 3-deoxy-8-phosphooctulonate synthase [Candidatus Manganitrophus sp.]